MEEFFSSTLALGLASFVVALAVGAGPLVYVAFRINTKMTRADEDLLLLKGKQSIGVEVGATIVCQAILMRHAVTAVEAAVQSLFVYSYPAVEILVVLVRCLVFIVAMAILSVGSIAISGFTFRKLNRKFDVMKAIEEGNLAVALFFGLVLIAMALVLDPGMESLAHSCVPLLRTGALETP